MKSHPIPAGGRGRRFAGIAAALSAVTLLAGEVLAATADATHGGDHGGQAEHAGGLPQLDPAVFPTQLFWLAVTFATLYWLMSKKALPRVAEVLEERQDRISRDLGKAGQLKDEAESVLAAVDAATAKARGDAQAEIARTVSEIERAGAERQTALGTDIAARLRDADARIQAAKDAAIANVRSAAADIARDVAGRLAGVEVDAARAEAAVAAAIEERR